MIPYEIYFTLASLTYCIYPFRHRIRPAPNKDVQAWQDIIRPLCPLRTS